MSRKIIKLPDLEINQQIRLWGISVVVVFVLVIGLTLVLFRQVEQQIDLASQEYGSSIEAASQIQRHMLLLQKSIYSPSATERERQIQIDLVTNRFDLLQSYALLENTDLSPDVLARFSQAEADWLALQAPITAWLANPEDEALQDEIYQALSEQEVALNQALRFYTQSRSVRYSQLETANTRIVWLLLGASAVLVTFMVLAVVSTYRFFQERQKAQQVLEEANILLEQRVADRTHRLELITQISGRLNASQNLEQLLNDMVQKVQRSFDFYYVPIYLLDEASQTLHLRAVSGKAEAHLKTKNQTLSFTEGLVGQAAQTAQPQIGNDRETLSQFAHNSLLPETQSELAVPLRLERTLIGVLDIQSRQAGRFTDDDLALMQTLADQAAVAISNVRLLAERERTNQELVKLNEDKDKFFSIVAHDLRGPFMPLLGNAQLLMRMSERFKPQEVKEMATAINSSAQEAFNLLESLLNWARMQMGRMEFEPEDTVLAPVVNNTITILSLMAESKNIKLSHTINPAYRVYVDVNMLSTVLRNLINNALKFTPAGGKVTIFATETTLPADQDTPLLEIAVQDTGVGIAPEIQQKLFKIDETVTTHGTENESGSGLGLLMCQEMVEMHGGRIWVESEVGQGATFKFTLPLLKKT